MENANEIVTFVLAKTNSAIGICHRFKYRQVRMEYVAVYALMRLKLKVKAKRDVAQSGLEYSSGGRVVASSNLVIPTKSGSTVCNTES